MRSAGFTLAEVLITLGIIGVVAALTIPTLVSNYQKRAWTAQLQKSYATLNQGFRRMLADDGVDALLNTETFQSIELVCGAAYSPDGAECGKFFTNLRKYFNIIDIKELQDYKVSILNSSDEEGMHGYAIVFADGTMILGYNFSSLSPLMDHSTGNSLKREVGEFFVDVNGISKPNKLGRDIFQFVLGDDGIVYPYGSMAVASFYEGVFYESAEEGYWKTSTGEFSCKADGVSLGMGCAARVLEEGKMNY